LVYGWREEGARGKREGQKWREVKLSNIISLFLIRSIKDPSNFRYEW
jgi:hypothetical protein